VKSGRLLDNNGYGVFPGEFIFHREHSTSNRIALCLCFLSYQVHLLSKVLIQVVLISHAIWQSRLLQRCQLFELCVRVKLVYILSEWLLVESLLGHFRAEVTHDSLVLALTIESSDVSGILIILIILMPLCLVIVKTLINQVVVVHRIFLICQSSL